MKTINDSRKLENENVNIRQANELLGYQWTGLNAQAARLRRHAALTVSTFTIES